jgi:anthranilate synthase component I
MATVSRADASVSLSGPCVTSADRIGLNQGGTAEEASVPRRMEASWYRARTEAMTLTSPAVATRQIVADTLTPVAAALRLGNRLAFLLESVEGGVRYGRYSILGVKGRALIYDRGEALVASPDGETGFAAPDPLEALRAVLPEPPRSQPEMPFPLASGVGYLAYEVAARWERLPVPEADPFGMPEAFFHLPEAVIVFDHLAQVARISAMDGTGVGERLDLVAELLGRPVSGELPGPQLSEADGPPDDEADRLRFQDGVARTVEEIRAGEMLQAVLARRFTVPVRRSAFEVYRSLRRVNPSPYLFYLDLGLVSPGAALVGASPELLVRVRDGEVVSRPIAGTRRRDEDPAADAALEAELREDPKELAEHAMLVDLSRNDVGRVSRGGSVSVPTLRTVERYSHVMHLVSEVRGRLADGLDAFDAVRATFPAGTVSGAPKVRAMQAIAEHERERRGPYGGAVGYFAPGDVEVAITIRSALIRDGTAFVQAGAGVVADSVPQREASEVAAKAGALLAALRGDPP